MERVTLQVISGWNYDLRQIRTEHMNIYWTIQFEPDGSEFGEYRTQREAMESAIKQLEKMRGH